ncbi:MAG: arsenite methyltransferase, partial [Arenicella sp.]
DKHHQIDKNKVFPVCGNTWRILQDSRFKPYFQFIGNFDQHFGIYAGCGTPLPFNIDSESSITGCC